MTLADRHIAAYAGIICRGPYPVAVAYPRTYPPLGGYAAYAMPNGADFQPIILSLEKKTFMPL